MKYIIVISISFLIISCQEKKSIEFPKKEVEVITMSQITTNYDTLIKRVKKEGNEEAYDELFYSFMDSNESERTDSLMIYSKIMAKNFNFEKAYFDYFKALCEKYNIKVDYSNYSTIDISPLEKRPKEEALNWLKNMKEKKIITTEQYNSIKK
jgi:hypothetical protein